MTRLRTIRSFHVLNHAAPHIRQRRRFQSLVNQTSFARRVHDHVEDGLGIELLLDHFEDARGAFLDEGGDQLPGGLDRGDDVVHRVGSEKALQLDLPLPCLVRVRLVDVPPEVETLATEIANEIRVSSQLKAKDIEKEVQMLIEVKKIGLSSHKRLVSREDS